MSARSTPLVDLTEKDWTGQVVELAKALGWRRYHTYRSDRSEPGWPDEALVRERLILLELKSERGKLSDAQRDWLTALLHAGVEAYVARPGQLDNLAYVLTRRERDPACSLEISTRAELGIFGLPLPDP